MLGLKPALLLAPGWCACCPSSKYQINKHSFDSTADSRADHKPLTVETQTLSLQPSIEGCAKCSAVAGVVLSGLAGTAAVS